ncbi:hypothetical protein [Hypericibacter adhaerens]|jgi:hypothetical protein|uniref:hypothetical protein n=1 Tax=Hypericibacter adhaerens TaxID=2602016 RepID=UPI002D7FBB33|nr:hypothetical protein [Hypericibacter adhaerens]
MRNSMIGLVFSAFLAAAALPLAGYVGTAQAQGDEPSQQTPDQLAVEGVNRLMQALQLLIQQIPQYDAPVIDENGNIIIRRRHDDAPIPRQKPAEPNGADSTST